MFKIKIGGRCLDNTIISIAMALLICARLLIMVFSNIAMSISPAVIVMGVIWALAMWSIFKGKLHLTKRVFAFIVLMLVFFLESNIISNGHVKDLTSDFFEYCLLGLIICSFEVNIEQVARFVCYLLLLLAYPVMSLINIDISRWQMSVTMDHCYAILPIILAVQIHFLFYRKGSNLLCKISYLFSVGLFLFLIVRGTRGVLFAGIIFIITLLLNSKKGYRDRSIRSVLLVIAVIFAMMNYSLILELLSRALINLGIHFSFLEKSIRLSEVGDFSNGRLYHYKVALEGFISSPLWGNGIGAFYDNYPSLGYPHNVLLQCLYEGGLIFGFPIAAFVLYGSYVTLFSGYIDTNRRVMMILFMCSSVPAAMLTSELWVYPILWMFLCITLNYKYYSGDERSEDTV